MYTLSLEEFMAYVQMRRQGEHPDEESRQQEKVLRPDQELTRRQEQHDRRLATCPTCDFIVDTEILHPRSGLCPLCHENQQQG